MSSPSKPQAAADTESPKTDVPPGRLYHRTILVLCHPRKLLAWIHFTVSLSMAIGLTKLGEHVEYSPLVMPAGGWQASLCWDNG